MRLTSPKDMVVGLSLASALLCFKIGAVFGPNPPSWFYRDLATAAAPAGPSPAPRRATDVVLAQPQTLPDLAPTVATFNDNPAAIGEVRVSGSDASTRVALQLSPGQADPRLTIANRGGQPTLTVTGLASAYAGDGKGSGLVERWRLNASSDGGRLDMPLTAPTRVARAFLTHLENGDRRLILDLAPACPVGASRRLQIVAVPPRATDARRTDLLG